MAVYRPFVTTGIERQIQSSDLASPGFGRDSGADFAPGYAAQPPNADSALATIQEGVALETTAPQQAALKYRAACLIAESALAQDPQSKSLAELHQIALRRLLHVTGADKSTSTEELAGRLASAGLSLRLSDPDWAGLTFTRLVPCNDYENRNIEPIVKTEGWGLPILADRIYEKDEIRPPAESYFANDNRLTCTARVSSTLVGTHQNLDFTQIPAELVLHCPFDEETIAIPNGPVVPLAADFTTPSHVQFSQSGLQALEYEGLLLPEIAQEKASIYLNEPYRPGKIPVLFVHGLWSSPRTWTDMNNGLLADPEIRRNYQFLFALYPTGEPVMESAQILREKIREIRDTFDPGRQDHAWDQMVVVCHSMGGIISRLLITDSNETFADAVFTKRLEELQVSGETFDTLNRRLRFQAVPEINRVAFLAPVFRGSSFASRPLGRLSSMLIRPVNDLGNTRSELLANHGPEIFQPPFRRIRIANGIDNLEPTNPFLLAMDKTMPAPDKRYHVVLGDNGKLIPQLRGEITDGLVTYESGHLDGAESEIIFQANHYLNHNKPVIDEVNRILRQHIGMQQEVILAADPEKAKLRR